MSVPVSPPPDLDPAADSPVVPTPVQPRPRASTAVVVLATLAVGFTLWIAQGVVLPILLALFLALVGNPIIRALQRIHIPRFIGALVVLSLGIAGATALAVQLVRPAAVWVEQAPRQMRQIGRDLNSLTRPVQEANRAAENMARAAAGNASAGRVQVVRTQVDDPYRMLTRAPMLVGSVLAVVLLTFFFMVFGERLQKNAVAMLPTRQRRKFTVGVIHSIEREISRYVFTITVINLLMGLAFAGLLHWIGGVALQEALLWGTAVALLNYAPYVGPLIGVGLMLLMGYVGSPESLEALLPAGLYLALHTLEGQVITPIVLGRSMRLSPLVLILALLVFGFLFGIIGLLLAVPLLVSIKLILARIDGMEGWARLLE